VFAKWGITPAASSAPRPMGRSTYRSGGPDTLNGPYSIDTFQFAVEFDYMPRSEDPGNFAEDNLIFDGITMSLDLKSGTCIELAAYLPKIFGKPDRITREGPLGYWWNKKGQAYDVNYYSWPDRSCGIEYSPIGSSQQSFGGCGADARFPPNGHRARPQSGVATTGNFDPRSHGRLDSDRRSPAE